MEKRKWLAISYNLPTEPSRYRVAAWRALRKLGTINLQQSMWVLPYERENYEALLKISKEIETNQGEAMLMECSFFDGNQEIKVISMFNQMRDEEYREFINECVKYLKEVEKEIRIEKFTFAEMEEEEEEMNKLIAWYGKISARDTFDAPEGGRAKEILGQIQVAFERFADLVYEKNNGSDLTSKKEQQG